ADRVGLAGEAQATREPADVRVDGDPLAGTKRVRRDDGGGLPSHAGQRDQLGGRPRDLAAVALEDRCAAPPNRRRLLAEEPGRPDRLLKLLGGDGEVV